MSLETVQTGIDRILRLDYLDDEGKQHHEKCTDDLCADKCELAFMIRNHEKRTVDVFELFDALEVVRLLVKSTSGETGPTYQNEIAFDFIHDFKKGLSAYFLEGVDQKETGRLTRKNQMMYHMVLAPIVHVLFSKTHEEAINDIDEIIDNLIEYIYEHDIDSSKQDVLVVRHLISKEVAERLKVAEQVDGIMRARNRKKKRRRRKKAA